MAQVGSIHLIGAANDIHTTQEVPAAHISPTREDVTNAPEAINQQTSNLKAQNISNQNLMVDDDDVQLVLSVPRRRKKKRKRFIFSNSPLGQYQETLMATQPKEEPKSSDCSVRRKSTSVVQRLESCHLGERAKEKETGQRRGSLPAVPISTSTPIQQLNWTHEPNYTHQQFPGFAIPMPWWEDSTVLPHIPMSTSNWVPWQQEDIALKKRKFENGCQDDGPRKQYRQSTQISPRTNPLPMPGMRFHSQQPQSTAAGTGALDRHIADQSTNIPWPSFDWEPYRIPNPQYVSPYTPVPMAMDITDSSHGNMIQQQPFQNWSNPTGMFPNGFDSNQGDCNMFSPSHSPAPQPVASPVTYSMQQSSPTSPLQQPVSVMRHQPRQPSSPVPPSSTVQVSEPSASTTAAVLPSNIPARPATQTVSQPHISPPNPVDILRRPSLYKIPAWPPTAPASPVVAPTAPTPQASTITLGQMTVLHTPANAISAEQLPREAQNTIPTSNIGNSPRINEAISTSPPPTQPDTPNPSHFQIPRARAGRKHSPNLIVDIAETCQEVFPFASTAERHGVPLQKVYDTFAAIIQLPLLRNADDRRRHGSLGKRRMKEYRDARKAMERAQEAERKAEMRVMRARVDEAAKNGQGQGVANGNVSANDNGKGLLKAAILNSAGKTSGTGAS